MFNCKILRIFSFLCLMRSSSHNSNLATIHFDECLNLTENNSYSQVSGEQNSTEQSSKAAKRTFSDLEGIDNMYKNKLFTPTLKENQTLIDSETGQGDDGSLNIFEIKDRSTYLNSLTVEIPEYQLDELFSIAIPVTDSSDNFNYPLTSNAFDIPPIQNNDSEESTISETSFQHQYKHVLDNITASSKEILNNSSIVNSQNNTIILKEKDEKESFEIYSDLKEFIAKVIYFRKDFYEFTNICLKEDNYSKFSPAKLKLILLDNPEYKYLFNFQSNSDKILKTNLMLLIHLSLDFAKRIEMYLEVLNKKDGLTQKICQRKKRICRLKIKLDSGKSDEKTRSELSQEIEFMKEEISKFESERESLTDKPCFKIIFKYVRYLAKSQKQFNTFGSRLITLFLSLIKITKFYDERLKNIVGEHLSKLRCPGTYKNRDILILQNSSRVDASNQSFYIDENSLTFVILDWVFYFFSAEFQEQLATGTIDSPKILSKLSALIFILSNRRTETCLPFSEKEFFDRWMISLKLKFEMEVLCQSSASNFFTELHDKIKHFDGNINMSEDNFHQKILKFHKLYFLNNLEIIIDGYLTNLYDKGLSEYNYYLSN